MSHTPESNICPNCGFATTRNYCAECGQETHLHRETFWGMVMHFIGHYVHYDSKFWQTINTLLFSPGKLTIAYSNRQRMRYIAPISLYIFISAMFFLIVLVNPHKILSAHKGLIHVNTTGTHDTETAVRQKTAAELENKGPQPWHLYDPKRDTANWMHFLYVHGNKLDEETDGNSGVYILEHLYHTLPKIFFFLIPLMALFLEVLFLKRKDVYFTDHSVFSLHYHSFVFTLLTLLYIPLVKDIPHLLLILLALALLYLVVAQRKVYKTGWPRATLNALFLGIGYLVFLCIALVADFFAILYFA
ncbi:MAG: DUF3667 domain-containing protein [Flavipsychrobacter sp.]|nr:DUF3667 domain-containing protein [Flavipsychrobacter sp.]